MKRLLIATAVIELGAGLALEAWPAATVGLLLGPSLESPSPAVVRLIGAVPLALGVASALASRHEPSRAARADVRLMAFYNFGCAAGLFAAGFALSPAGLLLWPAVALHAAMTVWCILCLRGARGRN